MIEQSAGKPDHAPDVIQREPPRPAREAPDGHVVAVNPRVVERISGKASREQEQLSGS